MPGPAAKPSALKVLQGTHRDDRAVENELTYDNMKTIPQAPDTFDEQSIELWLACCISLQSVGLLFPQDLPILEAYVFAVFMTRQSRLEITNGKAVEEQTNKSDHKYQSINKWVKINLEYSKEALRLGSQFGFSPASRTKISMGKPSTTDSMDGIL